MEEVLPSGYYVFITSNCPQRMDTTLIPMQKKSYLSFLLAGLTLHFISTGAIHGSKVTVIEEERHIVLFRLQC